MVVKCDICGRAIQNMKALEWHKALTHGIKKSSLSQTERQAKEGLKPPESQPFEAKTKVNQYQIKPESTLKRDVEKARAERNHFKSQIEQEQAEKQELRNLKNELIIARDKDFEKFENQIEKLNKRIRELEEKKFRCNECGYEFNEFKDYNRCPNCNEELEEV